MSEGDVWKLKVPIRLSLAGSEITSPTDVKPVYLLAARHAYLPALAQQSVSFFQHVLLSLPGQAASTPWFEFQGLQLNWTHPLGVLHDLLSPALAAAAPGGMQAQAAGGVGFSAPGSPWQLTVHYRHMPPALANAWQNPGAAKDHFFGSLKEAGYCCRGSDGAAAVMRLPGADQDKLWAAVNAGDAAAARRVLDALRLSPTQKQGGSASVPVRLYIRSHGAAAGDLSQVWEHTYSTSRPVDLLRPDGSPTLLADVLHTVAPQRFPALLRKGGRAAPRPAHEPPPAPAPGQGDVEPELAAAADGGGSGGARRAGVDGDISAALGSGGGEAPAAVCDPLGAAASSSARPAAPEAAADGGCTVAGQQLGGAGGAANAAEAAWADGAGEQQLPGSPRCRPPAAAEAGESMSAAGGASVGGASVGGASVGGAAAADAAAADAVLPADWPEDAAAYVCGVQPDWLTPLGWLHANMGAADCFLYVVVHVAGGGG